MKTVAIIPARGGSKRIPRKNIRDFLGKPIMAYAIEAASASGLFDDIIVSTDDNEISEIAEQYGAKVPFLRSKKNSDDTATLSDVIEEVTSYYKKNVCDTIEYGCCILPTAVLLSKDVLIEGYEKLINGKFDTVLPITRFSYPIQRALRIVNNTVEMVNPEYARTRSQDLESMFHDAGQFYWFRFSKGFQTKNRGFIELSELCTQDIDNEDDWGLAIQKFQYLQKKNS